MKLMIAMMQSIILTHILASHIDFSFYHRTNEINASLSNLSCWNDKGFIKETKAEEILLTMTEADRKNHKELKYYDIGLHTNNSKDKIFILGGEHAREMISPELLFNFIRFLCQSRQGYNLLQKNNFRIIVNLNTHGRKLVEEGNYCKRTNLHSVDLNRNWNIEWDKLTHSQWTEQKGDKPFSEIETQFANKAVESFDPKMFLSVHSGMYALYYPYAFSSEEPKLNKENMIEALKGIKEKYCRNCQMGSVRNLIGYISSGTCLDYVYDNYKVPYAFAWEIYSDESVNYELENFRKGNKSFYSTLKRNFRKGAIKNSFLLMDEEEHSAKSRKYTMEEEQVCLKLFNPIDKDDYNFIITQWTLALVNLIDYVNLH